MKKFACKQFQVIDFSRMNETATPTTQEAWKTIDTWTKNVHSRDIDSVVALYCPTHNAFWGTFANHVRCSPGEVRTYFDSFLDCVSISCTIVNNVARELADNVVSFTGTYEFDIQKTADAEPIKAVARYTFTVRKDSGTWAIVEHHSSVMPENGF